MFWYWEDVDRVYGGGLTDKECDDLIEEKNKEIKRLEDLLNEPSTQIVRDFKLNELVI